MMIYQQLATYEAEGAAFVVATVIDTGGSTPRLAGSVMAIRQNDFVGTIGGGAFEKLVIDRAHGLLAGADRVARVATHLTRDLGMCCGGRMEVFLQRIDPKPKLFIYGAGHVGTALADAAMRAGFAVCVIDERAEWAAAERFSADIECLDVDPEDHLKGHPVGPRDHVVVVTHSHPLDEALIRRLLQQAQTPGYVGLIGSRGKWARFVKRLSARDITEERLALVRCPVGLDIGAETPEEIAISVVAELIQCRRSQG